MYVFSVFTIIYNYIFLLLVKIVNHYVFVSFAIDESHDSLYLIDYRVELDIVSHVHMALVFNIISFKHNFYIEKTKQN